MTALSTGFGVSGLMLTPTGLCGVLCGDTRTFVGDAQEVEDMVKEDNLGDPDIFRYKIEVSGTGITEYYEYDEERSEGEVRSEWLDDVKETWGDDFGTAFSGAIMVTKLWETQNKDSTSERSAVALPPADQEE